MQVNWDNERTLVTSRKDAFVVEKWEDELDEKYSEPREAVGDTRLFMGGAGQVWLEAGVAEQLFWGGGSVMLRCGVKNNTKRHVSSLRVSLARRLIFPVGAAVAAASADVSESLQPQITDIVHQENFKGATFEFPPNHESVFNVSVDIPRDLRTIRKTRLFEVRCFALVSVLMGTFAKDLTVEIPIFVAHTASIQKAAQANLDPLHGQQLAMDAQLRAVQQFAMERGWSPAPQAQQLQLQQNAPIMRTGSAMSGQMIALPATPQPFVMANQAPGQLAWDPSSAPGWGASQLNVHPQIARPYSAQQMQRSFSAGPEMQAQIAAMQPPQAMQRPTSAMSMYSQAPQVPSAMPVPSPHGRDATAGSTHLLHSQGQGSARRASAPVPSQHQISPPDAAGMHSPAPLSPLVAQHPQAASQMYSTPPVELSSSPATYQPIATPLPPAPAMPQGLATITEDSESNAGTVKSVFAMKAGVSVTKNDVDVFEKMAANLTDDKSDTEMQAALAQAGLQWDEEEEKRLKLEQAEKLRIEADAAAASSRRKGTEGVRDSSRNLSSKKEQAEALMNSRPRASDIFKQAQEQAKSPTEDLIVAQNLGHQPTIKQSPQAVQPIAVKATKPSRSSITPSQVQQSSSRSRDLSPQPPAALVSESRRGSLSPSPGGRGLFALESRLSRPSSPMEPASPREAATTRSVVPAPVSKVESAMPVMAMANVAKAMPPTPKGSTQPKVQESSQTASRAQVQESAPAPVTKSDATVKAPTASRAAAPAAASTSARAVQPQPQEVEQRQLRSKAVNRIGDWLSQTPSPPGSVQPTQDRSVSAPVAASAHTPVAAYVDTPKTPAPSAFVGVDKITPSRFESMVESAAQKYGVVDEPKPKARAVSYDARSHVQDDTPTLSADLRALIDSSQPSGQRKGGNALKDHPISRRLSVNSEKKDGETTKPGLPANGSSSPFTAENSRVRKLSQTYGSGRKVVGEEAEEQKELPAAAKAERPGKTAFTSSPGFETLIHRPVLKANTAPHFLNKSGTQAVFSKEASPTTSTSSDKKVGGEPASKEAVEEPAGKVVEMVKPSAVRPSTVKSSPSIAPSSIGKKYTLTAQASSVSRASAVSQERAASKVASVVQPTVSPLEAPSSKLPSISATHPQSSASLRSVAAASGKSKDSAASVQAKFLASLARGDEEPADGLLTVEASEKVGDHIGGRGTTKAIGKNKLNDLRSIWGK